MSVNVRDKTYTGDFATISLSDIQINTLRDISKAGGHLPYNQLDKDAAAYLCHSDIGMAYKKLYKSHNGQQVYSVFITSRGKAYLRHVDTTKTKEAGQRKTQRASALWTKIGAIATIIGVVIAIIQLKSNNNEPEPRMVQSDIHDNVIEDQQYIGDDDPFVHGNEFDEPATEPPEPISDGMD